MWVRINATVVVLTGSRSNLLIHNFLDLGMELEGSLHVIFVVVEIVSVRTDQRSIHFTADLPWLQLSKKTPHPQ